jgi:hypothetical protein
MDIGSIEDLLEEFLDDAEIKNKLLNVGPDVLREFT